MISDKDTIRTVATNIRRLMQDRKVPLTQQALAAKARVQQSAISRLLNAQNEPTFCLVARIAAALRVPLDMLLTKPEEDAEETTGKILEKVS